MEVINFPKFQAPKNPNVEFARKFEFLVQGADSTIDKSSTEKVYDQLFSGIFLNEKGKEPDRKIFVLFARDMTIIWSQDSRYWKWIPEVETSNVIVESCELLNVCWLETKARIHTKKLSLGISYQVSFVLKMKDDAYGWENPVNLGLLFPDGTRVVHKKDLREIKEKNKWTEIRVGEFINSCKNQGEIEISMCGSEGLYWKKGIVILGVVIRPKN